MTWFTAVLVFIIIWWVVIFAVLPWGVRPRDKPEIGHEPSAPARPMLWRKALITTAITAVLWTGVYLLVTYNAIDFYE